MSARRSSIPGAMKTMSRRSTIGKMLTGMLPVMSPFLGQEDEDEDLWFNTIEDFNPAIFVLRQSQSHTSFFVKAKICKRNFVMHQYDKEGMCEKDGKRVRRMVDFMQWLRHPHIVKCMGAWESDSAYFVIEEYCHRANLFDQITTNRRMFTEAFVVRHLLTPLLEAVEYLHQMNIAHRGVIPENILFGRGNVLRLSGFLTAIEYTRSRPCSRLGPLDYTAPEVLELPEDTEHSDDEDEDDLPEYDEKVDIWQVGVLTYELLSGTCPFEKCDLLESCHLIVHGKIESFPPEFSPGAIDFIRKALNKNAHRRPTATDLLEHPWLQTNEEKKSINYEKAKSSPLWKRVRRVVKLLFTVKHWRRRILPQSQAEADQSSLLNSDMYLDADSSEEEIDEVEYQPVIPMSAAIPSGQEVPSILNMGMEVPDAFTLDQHFI